MNHNHPQYKEDSDLPLTVSLDDSCELFTNGENDYKRFLKEDWIVNVADNDDGKIIE